MEGSLWKPRLAIDKGAGGLPYMKALILANCAGCIVLHNHPSNDLTPSPEDIAVTERLVEAGKIIGIDVMDHLILSSASFLSLKEKGYI